MLAAQISTPQTRRLLYCVHGLSFWALTSQPYIIARLFIPYPQRVCSIVLSALITSTGNSAQPMHTNLQTQKTDPVAGSAHIADFVAAPQGFEPRYAAPEAAVLPLNEGATVTCRPERCNAQTQLLHLTKNPSRGQTPSSHFLWIAGREPSASLVRLTAS